MFDSIAIIGVGLIGGSIGMAARKYGVAKHVIGIGRHQKTLDVALRCGAVTAVSINLAESVAEADLVVACTPAATVAQLLRVASKATNKSDALFTDAASTKLGIVTELEPDVDAGMRFVGSHPLAGNHLAGPAAASPDLFEGRTVIVSPTESTSASVTRSIGEFWRSLGACVREMPAADHDRALAAVSHLPHIVASVLAATTPSDLLDLVATGWRDTTRVAAGNIDLWRDILIENRSDILKSLDGFGTALNEFQRALEDRDFPTVVRLLEEGKRKRDSVGN